MSRPLPVGVERTAFGFRAYVRVKGFSLQSKRFKRDVVMKDIIAWRERTRATLILQAEAPLRDRPPAGSFRAAVHDYLPQVSTMPSIAGRTRDLGVWLAIFGDEPIAAITPARIRVSRNQWLTIGPKISVPLTPYSSPVWLSGRAGAVGCVVPTCIRSWLLTRSRPPSQVGNHSRTFATFIGNNAVKWRASQDFRGSRSKVLAERTGIQPATGCPATP